MAIGLNEYLFQDDRSQLNVFHISQSLTELQGTLFQESVTNRA
jgi:hypothetical protein